MADHAPDETGQAEPGANLSAEAAADEEARLAAGRALFAHDCVFFHGAQTLRDLPPPALPEVAFAGRSNVGKSSLVNALTGRNALARVSSQPGRTRQLNFFRLGDRLGLVDMPGYGYAQAARSIKEDWQGTMFAFLRGRPTLRRVMLLLDARVEVKANDQEVLKLLDLAAVSFQVVLTKADAVKPAPLAAKQEEVAALIRAHPAAYPDLLVTSSVTGAGLEQLRAALADLAQA